MSDPVAKQAHVWARDPFDWYVEESRCTSALLSVEDFTASIHDPACGQGNIVSTCRAAGYDATGSDIVRRVPDETPWFEGERDFLKERPIRRANIICNPPFYKAKGAEAFIRRAIACTTEKVCMFVDVKFLAGGARAKGLYREFPPTRIWIISPRPSCPPGEYLLAGNAAGGGTADWIWIVWDKADRSGKTEFGWVTT